MRVVSSPSALRSHARHGRAAPPLLLLAGGLLTALASGAVFPAPAADTSGSLVVAAQAVLAKRCLGCHGEARTAGLDLRTRAAALRGGGHGPALVPGKPEESLLVRALTGQGTARMPPAAPLPPAEQDLLRRWIAAGAPSWGKDEGGRMKDEALRTRRVHPSSFIPHPSARWAFLPLKRPPVPVVKDRGWARTPLDAFVLAGLEAKGLRPAPEADPRTLIRRVTFDLTGLPPTPAEVEAFVRECQRENEAGRARSQGSGRVGARESGRGNPLSNQTSPTHPHTHTPILSSTAYERLVDRLLASPAYGERWGRHWLDVARFAESQGFERDKVRDHAWRYRDWVIDALNRDMPYDRFVRDQIAGDVVPGADRNSIAATGFLVAGPWDEVGNQQISAVMRARVREDELEDIVAAVGQTFLGLTVNCARCHDHKFDPIPQRDYYRLQAALAGVRHGDRSLLTDEETAARAAERKALQERAARAVQELGLLDAAGRQRVLERAGSESPLRREVPAAPLLRWTFETGTRDSVAGLDLALTAGASLSGGRLRLDGATGKAQSAPLPFPVSAKTLEAWVSLAGLEQRGGSALTLEAEEGRVFDGLVFGERQPRKWMAGSDSFRRTRDLAAPEETAAPGELVHVAAVYAPDGRIALYRNGQPYGEGYRPEGEEGDARTYGAGQGRVLFGLRHTGAGGAAWLRGEIEEARLYGRALTPAEVRTSFLAGPAAVRAEDVLAALTGEERARRTELEETLARAREGLRRLEDVPLAYAANPRQPEPVFLLRRGDVLQKDEPVSPAALSCLPGLSGDLGLALDAPERERRLKLAAWITSPANPLTPRVLVNRVWQYHFGRGLAASPSDFGANGERPSHPLLLDYLAWLFSQTDASERASMGVWVCGCMGVKEPLSNAATPRHLHTHTPTHGLAWSLKKLHRLIVTSATYRQSGRFDARAAGVDAEDRLLWRYPPRRLDAEELRDTLLAVSGQLNLRGGPDGIPGGPGFRPFSVVVSNSHFYTYEDRIGPEYNRRSIYRTVVNSGGIPLLEAFDCPDPSVKTPRRSSTTTPLQALVLLNNSFVLRQAQELARRLEAEVGREPERQAELAYRDTYGRPPTPAEAKRAVVFIREHGLAAFCRVMFNSSEFVYIR